MKNSRKNMNGTLIICMMIYMIAIRYEVLAAHPDYYFEEIKVLKKVAEKYVEIDNLTDSLAHNDTVTLEFDWVIANAFTKASGKQLVRRLPEVIDWSTASVLITDEPNGFLTGPKGTFKEYGNWRIVEDTKEKGYYNLVITFGPKVDEESDVKGAVSITADIKIASDTLGIPYTWKTIINETTEKEIVFNVQPTGGAAIIKTGKVSSDPNIIDWTIDINTNLKTLTSPTIVDEYSSLLKYDSHEIVYVEINRKGEVIHEGKDASKDLISVTPTDAVDSQTEGLSGKVEFKLKDTNKAYRIKLKTKIDEKKIDYNETDFTYSNRVQLNSGKFLPQVDVKVSKGDLITKTSTLVENYNTKTINWEININSPKYHLENVVVEDTLPKELTYNKDVEIKDAEDPSSILVSGTDYQVELPKAGEDFTFKITFKKPVKKEYIITYSTKIPDATKANDAEELAFDNIAKLRHSLDKNLPKVANQQATITKGKLLDKAGNGVISYNKAKYIDWTIYVNTAEISLGADEANRTVVDTISNNEYLVVSSIGTPLIQVAELTLADPKSVPSEGNTYTENSVYNDYTIKYYNGSATKSETDADINKFEVVFDKEIKKAYKITYRTMIQNHDTTSHDNQVALGTHSITATANPTIENVFTKESTETNYLKKEIKWLLTIDPIKEKIKGMTVKDTIPEDQYLSVENFKNLVVKRAGTTLEKKLVDADGNLIDNGWTNDKIEDYVIRRGTVKTESFNGVEKEIVTSFEIEFPNTINEAAYTIEYATEINPNQHGNERTYTNEGIFNWKGNTSEPVKKSAMPTLNDIAAKNGQKVGSIDTSDNRKINWYIDINYLSKDMSDNTITDNLPEGLVLVPNSVEVYETTVDAAGDINEGKKASSITISEEEKSFEVKFNGNHYRPYRIKYVTQIDDVAKDRYTNTAIQSNGEKFTGEVEVPHYDKFINKSSVIKGKDSIDYTLVVNESHSLIKDLVITDTLSAGLQIDMKSFAITEVGMNFFDYFDITKKDKTLVTDPTVIVMKAKETVTIDKPFTITYTADIIEEDVIGKKVSNSVEITGESINHGEKTDVEEADFSKIKGFGTGTGAVGSFKLTKVDKDDHKITLAGAEYELKRVNGDKVRVLGNLVTDANGEIHLGNLLYLKHTLTEIKAPEGYKLDAKPIEFTIGAKPVEMIVENERNRSIAIKKVDKANKNTVLEGAVFEIYDDTDTLVDTITTDSTGYAKKILEKGEYKVVESTPPNGYLADALPQQITIDTSKAVFELFFENSRRPMTIMTSAVVKEKIERSIKIKKIDKSNENIRLEGAVFEIYDVTDTLVATVTTDSTGYVSKILEPGEYKIVESRAPKGYLLDSSPQQLIIDTTGTEFEVVFANSKEEKTVDIEEEKEVTHLEEEVVQVLEVVEEEQKEQEETKVVEEIIIEKTTKNEPVTGTLELSEGVNMVIESKPHNGKIEVDEKGTWVYTPNVNFEGEDEFLLVTKNEDEEEKNIHFEIKVKDKPLEISVLPQTGESIPWINYTIGAVFILLGAIILKQRK